MTTLLFISIESWAQNYRSGGGGNGGDYIRMKFIEVGNFVLKNYKSGLKKIETLVTVNQLKETLDIRVIKLSDERLIDNGGSLVDAIGMPGKIILFQGNKEEGSGWYGIFKKSDLVEKLVLHEMLRAAGINDDNYIHSSKVLEKFDISLVDSDAYLKWCSESAGFIESALSQGLYAKTYSDQRTLYMDALEKIESHISPKHFYFVRPSVTGIYKVMDQLKSEKSIVQFLRIALEHISLDIRYASLVLMANPAINTKDLGDHAQYALNYLESASKFTFLADNKLMEKKILDIVFEQTYAYMINSDYARVSNGAVLQEIDSAIKSEDLSFKRSALANLKSFLSVN
jgi:hypothetical protein